MTQRTKTVVLKPCPFCGGTKVEVVPALSEGDKWISCCKCRAETAIFRIERKAVNAWNRRTNRKGNR